MSIDPQSLIAFSLVANGFTGALTSFGTISVCHPLFTIKTRQMSKLPFPRGSQIYKGYCTNLMCDMSYQVVAFVAFNYFSKKIMQDKALLPSEKFLGGFFAGMAAAPLLNFLERIMILQQVSESHHQSLSIKQIAQAVVVQEGKRGLCKGLIPAILRESINGACFFGLSQLISSKIEKISPNFVLTLPLSYQLAGALAGALSSPFDLIKTRMQNHFGSDERLVACIRAIGIKNLFVGAAARSCTISSSMMLMGFFSHNVEKRLLQTSQG